MRPPSLLLLTLSGLLAGCAMTDTEPLVDNEHADDLEDRHLVVELQGTASLEQGSLPIQPMVFVAQDDSLVVTTTAVTTDLRGPEDRRFLVSTPDVTKDNHYGFLLDYRRSSSESWIPISPEEDDPMYVFTYARYQRGVAFEGTAWRVEDTLFGYGTPSVLRREYSWDLVLPEEAELRARVIPVYSEDWEEASDYFAILKLLKY